MAKEIFVIAEHHDGALADITLELLTKARHIAGEIGGSTVAVILGTGVDNLVDLLKSVADKVIYIENEKLSIFHSEYFREALTSLIGERKPFLVITGQTALSYDFAPALATALDLPLVMGTSDFRIENEKVFTTNMLHGGKINAEYSFDAANGGMLTLLPASIAPEEANLSGEVEKVAFQFAKEFEEKQFIQFVEAAAGEIDITQADKVIAIGRGIKEEENMQLIDDFADAIGAVVGCSRPIVDAGWLPKDRQIGSSGKTVKPKLYIAIGISGAFQHTMGMKSADTIIAVNKDANAPIFSVAHYGIVDDLFKVVPALKAKIEELKNL